MAKTEHGIFVKFKKPSKTAVVLIAGVTISGTPCPRHIIVPFGAEAPLGPRGPGLSNPTSFLRPASPNGTDNRQQRQRRTERPPPEPSDILKRFYALYDVEGRYFMKKVSKLYYFLIQKIEIFLGSRISKFLRPAQRYDDF